MAEAKMRGRFQRQGKINQKHGEESENLARNILSGMGFVGVEKIETGWKVIFENKRPIQAWPIRKVSGDVRALMPDGRGVHIEVKDRRDKIVWSDLKKHQIDALNLYAENNAVALLVWVADSVYVLQWPIESFGPRKSITIDVARRIAISDISQL